MSPKIALNSKCSIASILKIGNCDFLWIWDLKSKKGQRVTPWGTALVTTASPLV